MKIPNFHPFPNNLSTYVYEFLKNEIKIWRSVKKIPIKQRIAEMPEILNQIYTDKLSYNLIAPMNSGKTYTMIKYALDNNIKMIMVMPLQILVKQKIDEFLKNKSYKNKIISTHYKREKKKLVPNFTGKDFRRKIDEGVCVILTVYDSLPKIFADYHTGNELKNVANKFTLVIDEAHNLVTQYGFRYKAIWDLMYMKDFFRKTIYLTGTPEFCIYNKNKTIVYEQTIDKDKIKLNCIRYGFNAPFYVYNFLAFKKFKGKVVIIYDNINQLLALEKLISKNFLHDDPKRIQTFYSSKKENDEFIYLIEHDEIPTHVKFILSTRVMSDGINLNNLDIDAVIFVDQNDFALKRQFIARFRNGIRGEVYDFIGTDKQSESICRILNPREYFQQRFDILEKLPPHLNNFVYNNSLTNRDFSLLKPNPNNFAGLGFSVNAKEYISCPEGIGFELGKVYNSLFINPPKDCEYIAPYYKYIAGFNYKGIDSDALFEKPVISMQKLELDIFFLMNGIDISKESDSKNNIITITEIFYPGIFNNEYIDPEIKNDIQHSGIPKHKVKFNLIGENLKGMILATEYMITNGFTKEMIGAVVNTREKQLDENSGNSKKIANQLISKALLIKQRIDMEILETYKITDELLNQENELSSFNQLKKIVSYLKPQQRYSHKVVNKLLRKYTDEAESNFGSKELKSALLDSFYEYYIYQNKSYLKIDAIITKEEFLGKLISDPEYPVINKTLVYKGFERMINLSTKRLADKMTNKYKLKRKDIPQNVKDFLQQLNLQSTLIDNKEAIQKELKKHFKTEDTLN